eukprot:jgi/Psemu1/287523/fgenesh1_pg.196_\
MNNNLRLLLVIASMAFVSPATLRGVNDIGLGIDDSIILMPTETYDLGFDFTTTFTTQTETETDTQRQHDSSQQQQQQQRHRHHHHRELMPGTTCRLYLADIEYGTYSEEQWICKLSPEESKRFGGLKFVDIVDADRVVGKYKDVVSGRSELAFSTAFLDPDKPQMFIPEASSFSTGNFTTLVIRVIDSNGISSKASIGQLEKSVFNDKVCLKSQLDACSYGKVNIQPFQGETNTNMIERGVVDLDIDYDLTDLISTTDRTVLQARIFQAAASQIGDLDDPKFDLVLFCLPSGEDTNITWVAYAIPDQKYSFYSGVWCSSVSAQLHEVGHNFNLGHSGEIAENKYSDTTGMMGFSWKLDDGPKMCYNPAKSYQLGWYDDKVLTINPLSLIYRQFTMNGISDYTLYPDTKDTLVVLRLTQTYTATDYYIGYNRKSGVNSGTAEDADMITISRKDDVPGAYASSLKLAKLDIGESYVIEKFNGQRDVMIQFLGRKLENATISIVDVDSYAIESGPPPPCTNYTIEVVTDNFPGDNSWYMTEADDFGTFISKSVAFTEKLTPYETTVCLKYSTRYHFFISDKYGDGICCKQGIGSYTIRNAKNQPVLSSKEEKFRNKQMSFTVEDEPKPCAVYTMKVVYDKFHTDNSWRLVNEKTGKLVGKSPIFAPGKAPPVWEEDLCLEFNSQVNFVFEDSFGDGMCCSRGNGSFKLTNSRGRKIIVSPTGRFRKIEESFKVGSKKKLCKDRKKEFLVRGHEKQDHPGPHTCEWYAEHERCGAKTTKGTKVWQLCPGSCGRCEFGL